MRTATYAGINLTDYFYIKRITRSLLPPVEVGLLNIPARHGAYFTGRRYGVRKIDIEITVLNKTPSAYMDTIRFLAFCLNVEMPTDLLISDEPTKINYAILSGDTNMTNQILTMGEGTLSFICPDPFAYSLDLLSISPVERLFTFDNKGTAPLFPKFLVNFAGEATFVSFTSPDGVILIGTPNEADKIILPQKQYALDDAMTNTTSWSNAGSGVLDAGMTNAGTVAVQGGVGIGASSFGTGESWHGPAIRKDLAQPIHDFTVKAILSFSSTGPGSQAMDGKQIGRIEIYLVNSSGAKIGKMVMKDNYGNFEGNVPEIYIGNKSFLEKEVTPPKGKKVTQKLYTTYVIKKGDTYKGIAKKHNMSYTDFEQINNVQIENAPPIGKHVKVYDKTVTKTVYPDHVGVYNDFLGELQLSRVGTKWHAEIARIGENGKKSYRIQKTFYDKGSVYTKSDLAYIVIHYAQFKANPVVEVMRVNDLKVIKHNMDTVIDIPVLFSSGDELEVNLTDSSVWLNGDPLMNEVDIGSTFFAIEPGQTEVKVNTDDPSAVFSAEYQERFI